MDELCRYCLRKLSFIFVKCVQCQKVLLCLNCFRLGAESSKHKKCHKYMLKRTNFQRNAFAWSLEKEIAFLKSVESCGLGNWLDVSSKVKVLSPLECRQHFESTYVSGIMGCLSKSVRSISSSFFNAFNVNKRYSRVSPEFCKSLGLMPKRDDYECDFDNNAELSVVQIRSDFLDDELYRDMALVCIDMFIEKLRQRKLRHIVATKLNLLTHLLPELLPTKARGGNRGNIQARVMSGQLRSTGGSNEVFGNRLLRQRQRRHRMLQFARSRHSKLKSVNSLNEESFKQPPSSIESLQDSGVAFSESSLNSLPSEDTSRATVFVSSLADETIVNECNRSSSPPTASLEPWSCPLPHINSLDTTPSENSSYMFPFSSPLSSTIEQKVTLQHSSGIKRKSQNQIIVSIPPSKSLSNCCTPPFVAEPLKPLLRFLFPSETNILLHQLHREHILRQEIEQLQHLKQAQGVFPNEAHFAGGGMTEVSSDSEEFSQEDAEFALSTSSNSSSAPARRRGNAFAPSMCNKRQVFRPRVRNRVRLGCRDRGNCSNWPPRSGALPKRRGRPPLHNQGHRQQNQFLHM